MSFSFFLGNLFIFFFLLFEHEARENSTEKMYLHLTGWHEMEVGCGIYQMAGLTVHDKCWFDWWQDGDLKMASSSLDRYIYMRLVSKAPMQE